MGVVDDVFYVQQISFDFI